jgi:MYXO-CTERM domain-containing protein
MISSFYRKIAGAALVVATMSLSALSSVSALAQTPSASAGPAAQSPPVTDTGIGMTSGTASAPLAAPMTEAPQSYADTTAQDDNGDRDLGWLGLLGLAGLLGLRRRRDHVVVERDTTRRV